MRRVAPFGRVEAPQAPAMRSVPLHQVPEALQPRAIDQRARQAAPRLPEMQVAGGGADVRDVFRQDGSQELAGEVRALHVGIAYRPVAPLSAAHFSHGHILRSIS